MNLLKLWSKRYQITRFEGILTTCVSFFHILNIWNRLTCIIIVRKLGKLYIARKHFHGNSGGALYAILNIILRSTSTFYKYISQQKIQSNTNYSGTSTLRLASSISTTAQLIPILSMCCMQPACLASPPSSISTAALRSYVTLYLGLCVWLPHPHHIHLTNNASFMSYFISRCWSLRVWLPNPHPSQQ